MKFVVHVVGHMKKKILLQGVTEFACLRVLIVLLPLLFQPEHQQEHLSQKPQPEHQQEHQLQLQHVNAHTRGPLTMEPIGLALQVGLWTFLAMHLRLVNVAELYVMTVAVAAQTVRDGNVTVLKAAYKTLMGLILTITPV